MQYDPIKKSLGKVFNQTPWLRIFFYRLLDLLLLRSWHIRRELKKWARNVPDDANILDAGSGFGQYVWRLASIGKKWQITGLDIKTEQIEDCNNFFSQVNMSNRVHFKEANLVTFNETGFYNLILSVDVMEHIEEDELVMKNLHRALKPGGILMISTPSDQGGSDTHHHHDEDGVHGFIDEHVRDGYNMNDIGEKLLRAGFSRSNVRYTYGTPGSIAWKLTMKFPILMLNKTKLLFVLLPFYYLVVYPIAYILNHFDVRMHHKKGTGLLVIAYK
jgi:SAM-dependent methyltransferase